MAKLDRIAEEIERAQERRWATLVEGFRDHLIDALHAKDAPNLDHVEELHDCAQLLDCGEVIACEVLQDAEIAESEVPRSAANHGGALGDFIHEMLGDDAPQKAFVYVAWSARPEAYWYVGQASNESRIRKIRQHGNLSLALRDATLFTLIYPRSRQCLDDVESALLRALKHVGRFPPHNGSLPRPPHASRREKLRHMSRMLNRFGQRLA
jgi:hypothetical protein